MTGFLSEFEGKTIAVIEEKCIAKGDEHCEFRFASSAALYVEEAIRLRNKMVKEMASRYARERETRLCAWMHASCLGLQVRQNYSSEPNRRANAVTPVDKDNVIKSEATIQGG